MTAEFLWINIPLMALFFALWVGVPMWMIFKRPERAPQQTRMVPAYLHNDVPAAMPVQRQTPAPEAAEQRELVGAGR